MRVNRILQQTLVVFCCFNIACEEEKELPSKVVYGNPGEPIVFNLKSIIADLDQKTIAFTQGKSGNAYLLGDRYLVYEADVSFENDLVSVLLNGQEIATIVLFSTKASGCQPFARSYSLTINKNSNPLSNDIFTDFCQLDVPQNRVGEARGLKEIPGVTFSILSGFLPEFIFQFQFAISLPTDFVGEGLYVYDVGAVDFAFNDEIENADYLLSGLIKIKVVE